MKFLQLSLLATPLAVAASNSSSFQPNFGYQELYTLQKSFYDRFLSPNNIKERDSINSTIFSEDVQGRVSDSRTFTGRELNTEYIFGLFTPSSSQSIIGLPIGPYTINQFAANQNVAAASARIDFIFPSFGNKTLPVTIDTWLTWNSKREITQYDATFRWFGLLLQTLLGSLNADAVKAQAGAQDAIAKSVCKTHDTYCKGDNVQYASNQECYDFLTKETRFGESFELGRNTLVCRSVHEGMLKFRPDVHCSHIGKTGGGMCDDDMSYAEKVDEKYFSNAPWIPTMV